MAYSVEEGLLGLNRHVGGSGIDHVHFYLPRSYILGSLACELARFKGKRIYSRRALAYGHKPAAHVLEVACHRRTDILVGNSPAVCDELQSEASKADIRLIRNGVDLVPLPHRDSGSFTILCVANAWPHKHLGDLINAVGMIGHELPDPWRLVLVGRGTEQYNAYDRVYGYGYRRDIPEILSTADVFVMPSCAEGCPNAVLEAMAAGVPVIAADTGGNTDAVEHGVTGVLCTPRKPENLASALLMASRCPEQFKVMADNAKARVNKLFSMETCINRYEQLYA